MDDGASASDRSTLLVSSPNPSLTNKRKLSISDANPKPPKRPHKQPQPAEDHRSLNVITPSPPRVTLAPVNASPPRSNQERNRTNERSPGYFQNARQLVFNYPTLVDGSQHIHVNHRLTTAALQWLQKYVMTGAEHNSAERDPPPRCHPGTRTSIISRGHDWFRDLRRNNKLLWLNGSAGVGKSAIIQTLVESLAESDHLGASVFFSLTDQRTSPTKLFPTIAYQLAVHDLTYRAYIEELMVKDPRALETAIDEQFRLLIAEPFGKRNIRNGSKVWLIALDGLDECGDDFTIEPHAGVSGAAPPKEQRQCGIIRLISEFILTHPSVPLKWIIASRPEQHLKTCFERESVKNSVVKEFVPIDSTEGCRDVERFLRHEFHEIRQSYPEFNLTSAWPKPRHFLVIATAAKGLFIFAFLVAGFIGDHSAGNPIAQLHIVLSLLDELALSPSQQNPLANLDAMYSRILSRVPSERLSTTKRLLGSCILVSKLQLISSQVDLCLISNVLGITHDSTVSALRQLHSVLQLDRVSQPKGPSSRRSLFYHASFQDFLVDKQRSRNYWVDTRAIGTQLFWSLLEYKLGKFSRNNPHQAENSSALIFNGIPFTWPPDPASVPTLRSKLSEHVEEAWVNFLRGGGWGQAFKLTHYHIDISIPPSRMISILENLDFDKMFRKPSSAQSFWFGWDLCKTEFFRRELEKIGFLSFAPLVSLDIEALIDDENVDVTAQLPCVGFHRVKSIRHTHSEAERGYVKELRSWAEKMPQTDVKILGRGQGKRCALFAGPRRGGQSGFYLITCL
ncbi:hypothetical protein D9756_001221 [Leucocoprinus leucothites]|uniref:NACHT domain-containing protein n=1 Tax=Leucocoprinus leucothites TaxID=201217 RepID=A0A8H5LHN6_9AGAR|nr:hypothetical protein D9756_001221 [Leucoagaricus leucothites]